jgi:protein phosphatase
VSIEYFARTDVGKVRKENQDSYGVLEAQNFYVVCDGMGGGAAGDFASRCAVDILLKSFEVLKKSNVDAIVGELSFPLEDEYKRPIAALRLANRVLHNFTKKYPNLMGMGTTVVTALFDLEHRRLHIYHVGDSRLYRIRNGVLELMTKDHSKVNELIDLGKMREDEVKTAEIQSMITRALGTNAKVKIDYRSVELLPDDCFVMCTDGLNGEIDDDIIRNAVIKNNGNVQGTAMQLVDCANNAGGRDNTTVIALRFKNGDYGTAITYPITTQEVVTVGEENAAETIQEDKLFKPLVSQAKIKVPKIAKQKGLFNNPLILGLLLTAVIVGVAFFPKKVMNENPGTKLTDLAGKIAGVQLDVRTPSPAQLAAFRRADDSIQKLQLIQDWFRNKERTTEPLHNFSVAVTENGQVQLSGVTGKSPLDIKLPVGGCSIRLGYKNYKIITERMALVGELQIPVEMGASLQPVVVIMIPAD